jgi:hypothetical protein
MDGPHAAWGSRLTDAARQLPFEIEASNSG